MQLSQPLYLWLFLIYVPLIAWYVMKHRNAHASMALSSTSAFGKIGRTWKV